MNNAKIAFIGAGNMTRSMVAGLIKHQYPAEHICLSNPTTAKLEVLSKNFKVRTTTSNKQAAADADVLVLAVKPQQIPLVCNELSELIAQRKPLLISVAVSISTTQLQRWCCHDVAIVRCMPNIAALLSASITGLFANEHVSQAHKNLSESILRSIGSIIWCQNEAEIEMIAATSGSGPAYVFSFMEALKTAATQLGLSPEQAHMMVLQTTLGAARLAMECGGESLSDLRRRVTSPNGITEAAMHALNESNFSAALTQAVVSAHHRAQQLTEQFDER